VPCETTNEPLDPDAAPVVGIIGGHGGIGSFFTRVLQAAGVTVLVSDRGTRLGNVEVAARCDLTLVSVPLRATPAVLAEVAPHMRPDAALASLGSLMELALPSLDGCVGETFLLHPLFGPGRHGLPGTTLALAPLRGGRWRLWLSRLLEAQGARIVMTTPEEHDRAMIGAQALLHGTYTALAPEIMATLPGDDPLTWATPTLRLQLALMSRILYQDPALYGDILALNRHTPLALDRLIARLTALRVAALDGPDAVAAIFDSARDLLGSLGQDLAIEGDQALGEGSEFRAPVTLRAEHRGGYNTMSDPQKVVEPVLRVGADASDGEARRHGNDGSSDIEAPSTRGLTIRDLGWTHEQAETVRARLASFAEDWDATEMDVYDTL
jgi:prephenate dehydrogenase